MDPSILLANLVFRIFFMWICYVIAQKRGISLSMGIFLSHHCGYCLCVLIGEARLER